MSPDQYILSLSCPDRPGIVAGVAAHLYAQGCNILEAHQFDDQESGLFFMRVVFERDVTRKEDLWDGFASVATQFNLKWTIRPRHQKRRVMILVSLFDHCLVDLLYRWRVGEIPMEITAIVSNHTRAEMAPIDFGGIPFHHIPVTKETKLDAEAKLQALIEETGTEIVVLARYMQILSTELSAKLMGRCINIHHSFLPGFKGARPYQQAHARGVKLIGATAHYVTPDLDEGPIIEQDVERISHADNVDDLIKKGRDIERRVLARALTWHIEDRVLINGRKTVVFRT